MTKNLILLVGAVLSLTSCNLYGGLSKPSGDAQLLLAARAALDSGDYAKAQEYYAALSSANTDTQIAEGSLTTLASNNIFSMSDLIGALGSNRGDGASFAILANTLAARGKTDSNTRVIIQTIYANAANISNPQNRAFTQFIAAISMYNSVLAAAVPSGGTLVASNLVATPSTCKAATTACTTGSTACDIGTGTGLADTVASDVTSMSSSTGWSTAPSVDKLIYAVVAAKSALDVMTGGSSAQGLLATINTINSLAGSLGGVGTAIAKECKRKTIADVIFP